MANTILGVLIILAGIILAFVAHLVYTWLKKRASTTETKWDDILLLALGRPLIILILFFSVYIAVHYYFEIPPEYAWILSSNFADALYIIIGAWVVSTFTFNVLHIYGRAWAAGSQTDVDDQLIDMLEIAAKYVIWFVAILMVLSVLEFDITPLLAAAGILGLAFALAAQDIIGNVFGGAMITVDKPFRLGDRVKIEGYVGDVAAIGPRSTRILTLDNLMVTIPNSKISSNVVVNYSQPEPRVRVEVPVSVAYGSNLARVREVLLEIGRETVEKSTFAIPEPAPDVFLREFGDSAILFTLRIWAKTYGLTWEVQDYANALIDRRFREEGIEIPFPQVDVHVKDKPGP